MCAPSATPNLAFVGGYLRTASKPNLKNPSIAVDLANQLGPERAASYLSRYIGSRIPVSATACLINDRLLLVGLSGEFTSQAANHIRLQHNTLDVCVFGYCNGYDFVFPGIYA